MKNLSKIGACALLAAGVVTSAFGQLQYAGNNIVNLDFTGLPVGPIADVSNTGTAGGVFEAYNNNTTANPHSLGPQVIALGGSGTQGALFDANYCLRHLATVGGAAQYPPAGIVGTTPNFSVEVWVYEATIPDDNPIVSWGTRGNCAPNQVACSYGSNASWGAMPMWCGDSGWGGGGPPAAGQWHHLVWTFAAGGTEQIYVDGAPKVSYTGKGAALDGTNNILIGASHANRAGSMTSAVYGGGYIVGRVRIDDGVLTLSQVTNNYAYEVANFTNGVPSFLSAQPLHRWSFTNAVTGSAGGATVNDIGTASTKINAIVRNGSGTATFTGSALTLSGGSSATAPYVDLTNALISVLSTNVGGSGKVTIEGWVNQSAAGSWTPWFMFGSNTVGKVTAPGGSFNGVNYLGLVLNPNGGSVNQSAFGFQSANYNFNSHVTGSLVHMAVCWDDISNTITFFQNGVEVSECTTANRFIGISDINNWIGRSAWSGDANLTGSVYEFRVFNRIVTPAELLNDYQVGPTVTGPIQKWNGNLSGDWDVNNTANWLTGSSHVTYNDANGPVQFDDTLTGTPLVNVTTTVQPTTLTINNSHSNYVFSGSGSISGAVGLTKSGIGTLTINNANNYTGITAINAGTVIVTNLANGGSPSAIGAASASPANLALTGGNLTYQGSPATINRGYTAGSATLTTVSNLTISGLIAASGGNFTKAGPGTLTYNGAFINQLSLGDYYDNNGTVVLDGTLGETNNVGGQIFVGSDLAHSSTLILSNVTANLGSWLAIARGNGTGGYVSTANLYNSTMTVQNVSLGYANGVSGNNEFGNLNLSGTSHLINNGGTGINISESGGSTCSVTVSNNSWISSINRILIGLSTGSTGTLVIANSGAVTNGGWVSIGAPGVATATVQDNGIWQALTDFNLTDTAGTLANPSIGTLNIAGSALLNINTLYVGKSKYCSGTINQSGGTVNRIAGGDWRIGGNVDNFTGANLNANPNQSAMWNLSGGTINCGANFQVGAYGNGVFNQTGGNVNLTGGYPSIGRFQGGTGTLNVSAGSFNQLNGGTILIIGEEGTGTLNVSGTGAVNCMNRLGVGWHDAVSGTGTVNLTNGVISATNNVTIGNGGGTGTINLHGGTLASGQIIAGSGSSTMNFYGGTLQAMAGANANFLSGLSQVEVFGGSPYTGAVIDSGTNSITITQDFYDGDGFGSLTKLGSGSLTLPGNLLYSGATTASQGELIIPTTGATISGTLVAGYSATLGIQITSPGNQTAPGNVTLGSIFLGNPYGSTVQFDLNGNGVPIAPPLVTAGTLTLIGTNYVNVTGAGLTVGDIPLIQYATIAGSGSIVAGTLPPGVAGYIFTNTANSPNTIDLQVTSVNILLWTAVSNTNWDFNVGTDYNWTNILNSAPALYSQGSSVVFDDTAALPVVNLTTTNSPSSITFSNSLLNYTLQGNGKITGTTGITLDGTATVALNITNSTFSGPTVITGGSLTAGFPSALSPNSAVTVDNATLELNSYNQAATTVAADNALIDGTTATLTGTGFSLENTTVNVALAGTGSLTAVGTSIESVSVANNNAYTGKTVVSGGTLYVTNLQNGGSASSLGMSSASPTNLVLAGGTLSYQGTGASINRGYTITANSTLDTEGNLTLGGQVVATGGNFVKTGPANLTLSGGGSNTLAGNGINVGNGALIIGGTALSTNTLTGQTWVGYNQVNGASLILTNTTLTENDWFAVGRGNGAGGLTSTADLYNSSFTAGNVSFGYANGIPGNSQTVAVALHGNSKLIDNGGMGFNFTESGGSSATLLVSNTSSVYSLNRFLIGMTANATGTMVVADSGTVTVANGWFDVGNGGVATLTIQDNAVVQSLTDFNLTDSPGTAGSPSSGTLNVAGNAQLIIHTLYVGKAYGFPANGYCTGIVNQSGGLVVGTAGGDWRIGGFNTTNTSGIDSTLFGTYNLSGGVVSAPGNLQLGGGGTGEWYQTGGTAYAGAYPSVGRFTSSYGQMDISAGSFNQTNVATYMVVGESGTGVLNVTNSGLVSAVGGLDIGANSTGIGTANLGGGTLSVTHVFHGSGSSTLNLNGGLLQAKPGSFYNFMSGLTAANVMVGGANIDSGANVISIAQPLLNGDGLGGGLNKAGSGTLLLDGVNTYTGTTVVSTGTLGGSGTIASNVTVNSSAALQPGDLGSGTLTINGNITLNSGSTSLFSVNGSTPANTAVVAGGAVNYGGALNITPSGTFTTGQTFTLFSGAGAASASNFASITGTPGIGQAFAFTNGILSVVATVNTNPTNITATVSGSTLSLSWPADHTGWRLLVQTNNLAFGVSPNTNDWTTVTGSSSMSQTNITIDPAKPNEYYRLVYP